MRVLCRIANELRVYSISSAYNIDSMEYGKEIITNKLLIECNDSDKTSLLINVDKETGEQMIRDIALKDIINIEDSVDIIVESTLLDSHCNPDTGISPEGFETTDEEDREDIVREIESKATATEDF